MIYLVIDTFNYNPNARLFPWVVGIVAFLLAFIQFLVGTFPTMKRYFPFVVDKGVFSLEQEKSASKAKEEPKKGEKEVRNRGEFLKVTIIFVWLLAFVVAFNYFHYILAVFLFLFTFIWFFANEKPRIAFFISVGMCGFLFLVFDLLLGANM